MSIMFRTLTEYIPESIFFKDLKSRFIFVNRVKAEHMGLSDPAEAVGKTDFDFYDEEFARKTLQDEKKIIETGKPIEKIEKVRYRDGRLRWVKVIKAPLRDIKGKIIGIMGISIDITDLKRAEERAKRYLEVAEVIIIALDRNGRISLINRKGCEILGYESEEIIGKDWIETFIPERIRGKVRKVMNSLLSGEAEKFRRFENPILTRSGEKRMIEWYNTLLKDDEGKIIGILSSGIDVTEKKQYELKLRDLAYRLNNLSPGGIFISKSHERLFKAFGDLTFHGVPGLCLLREDPEKMIERYGIKPENIMIVAPKPLKGYPALDSLQKISLTISRFLEQNDMGIILLDGLEYLINLNGFKPVFRFIQEKHIDIIENGSILLMPFDLETLMPHERALLLSEAEELK